MYDTDQSYFSEHPLLTKYTPPEHHMNSQEVEEEEKDFIPFDMD
jgi:hypothetical protein